MYPTLTLEISSSGERQVYFPLVESRIPLSDSAHLPLCQVSRWFRATTIACDDILRTSLYIDAPFPRPPGPSPSQSTASLERMLVNRRGSRGRGRHVLCATYRASRLNSSSHWLTRPRNSSTDGGSLGAKRRNDSHHGVSHWYAVAD